jgi:cytochrome c oxidase subunit I+III
MPGPSAWHVLAAVFTAGFFLLLTVQAYWIGVVSGVLAVLCVLRWLWETDRPMKAEAVDIGAGICVPTYVRGPASHGWWAMMVLIVVIGMIFAMACFSYVFLWSRRPDLWIAPPAMAWLGGIVAGYVLAIALCVAAGRLADRGAKGPILAAGLCSMALLAAGAAFAADVGSWWSAGLRPDASGQGATVFALLSLQGLLLAVGVLMAAYLAVRAATRLLRPDRLSTADLCLLFVGAFSAQGALGTLLVRLFPEA